MCVTKEYSYKYIEYNIFEYNSNNIIIIIMTVMKICTNPVKHRTKSVSISSSGVTFIGHEWQAYLQTITNIKYIINNKLYK